MANGDGQADPHVGERLREARLARRDSLADISRATCISSAYLAHLEDGEFDELPGEVYVRGYIRAYALQVGLDPAALLLEYNRCVPPDAPSPSPRAMPRLRARHRSWVLWLSILFIVGVVGAVSQCT